MELYVKISIIIIASRQMSSATLYRDSQCMFDLNDQIYNEDIQSFTGGRVSATTNMQDLMLILQYFLNLPVYLYVETTVPKDWHHGRY